MPAVRVPFRSLPPPSRLRAVLAVLALVWPAALAQESVRVRFLTPTSRDIVSGPTEVRLQVTGDGAANVRAIDLFLDDELAATLAPPFAVVIDMGEDLEARTLRAEARTVDGRVFTARVTTRKFLANQIEEVALVNLFATLRDRDQKIVRGLSRQDFAVFEDGIRQTVERFTDERRPLAVGLVLDTSLTMKGDKLRTAQAAAARFVEALEDGDRALVVSFSDEPRVLHGLDDDLAGAAASLEGVEARGGTALYDAIVEAADALTAVPSQDRRVIVLLSDGRDEAASGLEPGSFHTLEEARDAVLKREVIVFSVGLGKGLDQQLDFYQRQTLAEILSGLAESTGGTAYFVRRPGQLGRAYSLIGETLRYQYSLAYDSTNERRDGGWRAVRLLVRDPSLRVVTREGYYAD